MTTLVDKYHSISREGDVRYFVVLYDQPLGHAMLAEACHSLEGKIGPLLTRMEHPYYRLTHRRGCPHPRRMIARIDGSLTEPVCVCLPLPDRLRLLCYRLAHSHRLALYEVEITEPTFMAITH